MKKKIYKQEIDKYGIDAKSSVFIKRIWKDYVSKYKYRFFISVFCMLVLSACLGAQIQLIEPTLNKVLKGGGESYIWFVGGAFFIIGIVKGFSSYLSGIMLGKLGLLILKDIQFAMYKSIIHMEVSKIEEERPSGFISKFALDAAMLKSMATNVPILVGKNLFSIVALFFVMLYQSIEMTLVTLLIFPMIIIPISKLTKKIRDIAKKERTESAFFIVALDDTLKGQKQIKTYNREKYATEKVMTSVEKLFEISCKFLKNKVLTAPIVEIFAGLVITSILIWGGYLVLQEKTDVGKFMTFFIALVTVYRPINALSSVSAQLQLFSAAASRVFEVIDYKPKIKDKKNALKLENVKGKIEFKNVSFNYAEKPTLENINVKLDAKEKIALVGPSGGGKSTLLSLLPRFYDVLEGEIIIDGININSVTQKSLRDNISYVSQEVILFDTTICENVRFGRLDATEAEIIDALKRAEAWDFVKKLPNELHSQVGERGCNLSGGQKQRISIARAFLKNAPILLLDEATSALDTTTERKIQKSLDKLMLERTTIIVAHRLSTIKNVDRIIVVSEGRIVEQGTELELDELKGLYYSLKMQSK